MVITDESMGVSQLLWAPGICTIAIQFVVDLKLYTYSVNSLTAVGS